MLSALDELDAPCAVLIVKTITCCALRKRFNQTLTFIIAKGIGTDVRKGRELANRKHGRLQCTISTLEVGPRSRLGKRTPKIGIKAVGPTRRPAEPFHQPRVLRNNERACHQ